jgi:CheY-like chemotaxis protein
MTKLSARGARQSALVLSASRLTRTVLSDLLRDFGGYVSVEVGTVPAFVRVARQETPEVLLLDASDTMLTMPELVRMIRSDDALSPTVRIICLVAGASRADVAAIRDAGGDAILSLPVVPQRLFRILSRLVAMPQAA